MKSVKKNLGEKKILYKYNKHMDYAIKWQPLY